MVVCNIEFAHIYSDEEMGKEHVKSAKTTEKIVSKLKKEGKNPVVCVLIDEYHPLYHKLNFEKYISKLGIYGVKPDYIGYESKLVPAAKMLLSKLPDKLKARKKMHAELLYNKETVCLKSEKELIPLKTVGKVKDYNRYTCPILAASWYLMRLGLVQAKNAYELTGLTKPKPFHGKEIVNVLSEKYKEIEEETKFIIANSEYKKHLKNIRTVYF